MQLSASACRVLISSSNDPDTKSRFALTSLSTRYTTYALLCSGLLFEQVQPNHLLLLTFIPETVRPYFYADQVPLKSRDTYIYKYKYNNVERRVKIPGRVVWFHGASKLLREVVKLSERQQQQQREQRKTKQRKITIFSVLILMLDTRNVNAALKVQSALKQ